MGDLYNRELFGARPVFDCNHVIKGEVINQPDGFKVSRGRDFEPEGPASSVSCKLLVLMKNLVPGRVRPQIFYPLM